MQFEVVARRREVATLCRKHRVRRLWLGGGTDVADDETQTIEPPKDWVVEFQPMNTAERALAYFDLYDDLEELFGRALDLVDLHTPQPSQPWYGVDPAPWQVYTSA